MSRPTSSARSATPPGAPELARSSELPALDALAATCEPARRAPLEASTGRSRPISARLCQLVLTVGAWLPLWCMQSLGRALGTVTGALPTRSRARSLRNLELCFPELSARARRRLARRSLASITTTALELPALWGWNRERVLGLVKEVAGKQHLDLAMERGQGVLLAMPHIGSWELAGLYVSHHHPMTALFRPSRLSEMTEIFRAGRSRHGATLVTAGVGAVRSLRRALKRGEVGVVLPDIDPKLGQCVFAPLFGVPANTSVLSSRLASGSGATLLMCFAERLGIGRGFRMHFVPTDPEVASDDALIAGTALNREVEATIRRAPDQYLWRYRRFRRRPAGEAEVYDR